MTKLPCDVVRDLLPLYYDGVLSLIHILLGRTSNSMNLLIKVDLPVRTGPTTPK